MDAIEKEQDYHEANIAKAIYKSMAVGESVMWSTSGDGRSDVKRDLEAAKYLVEVYDKLGIEVTFSKPVHCWSEAEDGKSGSDYWVIFLTAKRKA